ncbi:MAG: hypothetical protein ACRDLB_07665 [Actinomycetota bacterium]
MVLNAATGFTNRNLRAQVAGLLGTAYTSSQMTYELRRLRGKGLFHRLERINVYVLTRDGIRVTLFYKERHYRLLAPLLASDLPPAPVELRRALREVDRSVDHHVASARIKAAA